MPMRRRSGYRSFSCMALISSPKTKMRPSSGRSRPSASFSNTLLPTPAGPSRMRVSPCRTENEMSCSTCLPSKPMDTCSKTTTGSRGGRSCSSGATADWLMRASPAKDADHKAADDEVGCNDKHGCGDYGLRCRAAYALRATARGHSVIAADGGDNEAEEDGLDEALDEIGVTKRLIGGVEILRAVLAQHQHGHSAATGDTDHIGNDGEKEQHDDGRDNAWHHQLFQRVSSQGAHRINLLCHHHRAKFAGHSRCISAGDHEAGQHRPEFLNHGKTDKLPCHARSAELRKARRGLQRKYAACEKSGKYDDGDGAYTDRVGLGNDVRSIQWTAEKVPEGAA